MQSIKSQLETRVRELETANKQLESRLQRLRTGKMDVELTSAESSRATSPTSKKNCPLDCEFSTLKSCTTTTTGYSSSLPSSPNHAKHLSSSLITSVPSSPILAKENGCSPISNLWIDTRNACTNVNDDRLRVSFGKFSPDISPSRTVRVLIRFVYST